MALALTAVIIDLEGVQAQQQVAIHCQAPDLELLFVDGLNALIFEMATRRALFALFDIRRDGNVLKATAWGELVD